MKKSSTVACAAFNRHDISRLRKAVSKASDLRTYVRLKAVLLAAEGRTIVAVSSIFDKDWSTIHRWVGTYLNKGQVEDLSDSPRAGRPRSATKITDSRILKELKGNPMKLGYYTNTWTVATLAHHLNTRYGCSISARTLYRRMKAMDLRCKRPKYFYEQKDPNRAQKKGLLSES